MNKKKWYVISLCCVYLLNGILATAQEKENLSQTIDSLIMTKISIDYTSNEINANYELIYESNMSAREMFDKLMTKMCEEENVIINEYEGQYKILKTDEHIDTKNGEIDECVYYKIYLKDGKFKITADLASKRAYKWLGYDDNNLITKLSLEMPCLSILKWALAIMKTNKDFDF